jgi:hypothetical protein
MDGDILLAILLALFSIAAWMFVPYLVERWRDHDLKKNK